VEIIHRLEGPAANSLPHNVLTATKFVVPVICVIYER